MKTSTFMNVQHYNDARKRFHKSSLVILLGISLMISVLNPAAAQNRTQKTNNSFIVQLASAQNKSDDSLLSIQFANVTLQEALELLAEEINVGFSYNPDIMPDKRVSFSMSNVPPHEVIYKLLESTNLEPVLPPSKDVIVIREKAPLPTVDVFQQTITGTVADAQTGEVVPGVNVIVAGSQEATGSIIGTTTDMDGNYEIQVPDELNTLVFTYVGYQRLEVEIDGRSEVNVQLASDVQLLDDIVVIGYGTQRRVNVTGAISSVESTDLERIKAVNASELLQGQLSGIHTKQPSGQPGVDDVNISIRGFGDPLVLVDGIERNLSDLDPESIESVSVLKDASAAVYGARAGNGVILVTTKRGEFDQALQIRYDASVSAQQFTNKPRIITDAGSYLELWTEAEKNVGLTPTYSEETISKYKEGGPGFESYDWFDFAFKDYAPRYNQNLSVAGGGENISYFTSLGMNNQGGVISSGDWYYNRYNLRANLDGNITDFLTASLNLNYVNEEQSEAADDIYRSVYKAQPMAPTSFENSDLHPASNLVGTHQRLVGEMNKDIQGGWTRNRDKFYAGIELGYEVPFITGININARFDYQKFNIRNKETTRQWEVYSQDPETGEISLNGRFPADVVNNLLGVHDDTFERIKPRIDVNYSNDFGDHSWDGLFVAEYIEESYNNITARTQNLLSTELEYLFLGDATYHEVGQEAQESSRGSLVGRLQYAYQDKYLLEGTFRYDGSSFFPPDGRWGFFPSISAGWRISEESFMQGISELDELKLRISYSEVGFDANAIPYDYFSGYNVITVPPYIYGSQPTRRIQQGTLPNNAMTWEEMVLYNIGVDFSFWQGKFSGMVEGFYRERSNILTQPITNLPSTFGASLPQRNLNSMDNRGIELELTHSNQLGEVNYQFSANVTYSRAKWIHFEEENFVDEDEIRIFQRSGRWQNRAIGYVSDGLFRSQEEIDNHTVDQDQAGNSSLLPGDIRYKDLNGDGVIDFRDQKEIGNGTGNPDLNFGFNIRVGYKGFTMSTLLQGASMYAGYVSGFTQVPFRNASTPIQVHLDERFHPEKNPDGSLPLISMGEREHNTKFSDFWLKDITYLRIKNINLSYALPAHLITPIGIRGVNVYVTANNLGKMDNLGIWSNTFDPESGLGHNGYPPHRTYTAGIQIEL